MLETLTCTWSAVSLELHSHHAVVRMLGMHYRILKEFGCAVCHEIGMHMPVSCLFACRARCLLVVWIIF